MLTIERLATHAAIPRRLITKRSLIEQVAREDFPRECSRQLRGKWRSNNTVTRIRRLRVKVSLAANELVPDALAAAWSRALLRELFAALTHSNTNEVLHFASRTHYLAAAIRDCLNGVATRRWAYEEIESLFEGDPANAVLNLFAQERSEIVAVLLLLEDSGLLDRLVASWNESGLRRLFRIVSVEDRSQTTEPSIDDLISVSRLILGDELARTTLRTIGPSSFAADKIALRLFLRGARGLGLRVPTMVWPEVVGRAIRILRALVEWVDGGQVWGFALGSVELPGAFSSDERTVDIRKLLTNEEAGYAIRELLADSRFLSDVDTRECLRELESVLTGNDSTSRTVLADLLEEIVTPGRRILGRVTTKSTSCAGLFLLIRMIDRLGWEERLAQSGLASRYGPRLVTYALTGVALAVLDRFVDGPAYLDSGLALFAGWLEEPDLGGFRAFLSTNAAEERRDLCALLGQASNNDTANTWAGCFDALAAKLIQEFTANLRYFGEPSRAFVVRNFIALPGYIRIEDKRLMVNFTSNPLHIVLHLSGLDDRVEAVRWLGGKSVEFDNDGVIRGGGE